MYAYTYIYIYIYIYIHTYAYMLSYVNHDITYNILCCTALHYVHPVSTLIFFFQINPHNLLF